VVLVGLAVPLAVLVVHAVPLVVLVGHAVPLVVPVGHAVLAAVLARLVLHALVVEVAVAQVVELAKAAAVAVEGVVEQDAEAAEADAEHQNHTVGGWMYAPKLLWLRIELNGFSFFLCPQTFHPTRFVGTYAPLFQHYTMIIPQNPGTPNETTVMDGDVIGVMTNGVLLDAHEQTWTYDSCNGHSDKKHQYHYHIPPICFLQSLGIAFADSPDWWIADSGNETRLFGEMADQFPKDGTPSPVVGFARDGFPIYGPYDENGALQRSKEFSGDLDECNGKVDSNGDYGYYMSVDPPFAPRCLRGEVGSFSYHSTDISCPKDGISNKITESSGVSISKATTKSYAAEQKNDKEATTASGETEQSNVAGMAVNLSGAGTTSLIFSALACTAFSLLL